MNVNTYQFTLGSCRIRSMIGGNRSNRRNPLTNSGSLATFSSAKARISNPRCGERQQAVSCSALDHSAIRAGLETDTDCYSYSNYTHDKNGQR